MADWAVTFEISASKTIVVSADTQPQAEELAWKTVGNPVLCHHCSREITLGEPYEISEIERLGESE